jgi:hypothetical protein
MARSASSGAVAALASPGPENSKKRVSEPSQSASWTRPANKWPKAALSGKSYTARLKGQGIEAQSALGNCFQYRGRIVRSCLRFQKITLLPGLSFIGRPWWLMLAISSESQAAPQVQTCAISGSLRRPPSAHRRA